MHNTKGKEKCKKRMRGRKRRRRRKRKMMTTEGMQEGGGGDAIRPGGLKTKNHAGTTSASGEDGGGN